jgi:hypothetical protein
MISIHPSLWINSLIVLYHILFPLDLMILSKYTEIDTSSTNIYSFITKVR